MIKKNKQSINDYLKYAENDKTLKKIEKYVDKNREQTSKEIADRKSKRPKRKYEEGELEVMISRISNENQPKNLKKNNTKKILYAIYIIILIMLVIICIKYLFM